MENQAMSTLITYINGSFLVVLFWSPGFIPHIQTDTWPYFIGGGGWFWNFLKLFKNWGICPTSEKLLAVSWIDNFLQTPAARCHPQATSVDTRNVIKQWACDAAFWKFKPSKDVQSFSQSCALSMAFTGIVQRKLIKKDCKLRLWSRCTHDHNTGLQS